LLVLQNEPPLTQKQKKKEIKTERRNEKEKPKKERGAPR
jgi:hypothetical protein